MPQKDASSAYSIRDLTFYIKSRLEDDPLLQNVWVEGEISNLVPHRSGHVYFSLKDEEAQVSCAMWRSVAQHYKGRLPKHGEKVRVRASVSVYPPRGSYQLVVLELKKAGMGGLHQRFLELKDKLQQEGLFDKSHKKPIPKIPKTLAVLTSPTGAVFQDIRNTVQRRFPHVKLLLVPTAVQGPAAAPQIARNLNRINAYGLADLILLCRGGGSLEDLWGFNEEVVARAIHASEIPVISGVGHETDTTISDFVADQRAATPTAAAELAVPKAEDILAFLTDKESQFATRLRYFIDYRRQMLDDYQERFRQGLARGVERKKFLVEDYARLLEHLMDQQIAERRKRLEQYQLQLDNALRQQFSETRHRLTLMESQFKALDPRNVLQRGYTVTLKEGKMVRDAAELTAGDRVETVFEKGRRWMEVQEEAPSDKPPTSDETL